MHLVSAASIVFILNLPFGYWRANVQKFTRPWFLAIHLPVPLVIAVRIFSHLGWHLITFPVMIGAFFAGQLAGGGIRRLRLARPGARISSCLVLDLVGSDRKRPDVR